MGLTFKTNFKPKDLAKRAGLNPKVLQAEMLTAATEIIRRTQAQQGIEGNGLPKLSKGYARWKAAVGRNAVPDRTLTGDLLKAIQSKIVVNTFDRLEGLIYFQDRTHRQPPRVPGSKRARKAGARARSSIHAVAQAMQKLAPFFGLSRIQRQKLIEAIRRNIGK